MRCVDQINKVWGKKRRGWGSLSPGVQTPTDLYSSSSSLVVAASFILKTRGPIYSPSQSDDLTSCNENPVERTDEIARYDISLVRYEILLVRYGISLVRYEISLVRYGVSLVRYGSSLVRYGNSLVRYEISLVRYGVSLVRSMHWFPAAKMIGSSD